jgi:catechol 2,3-dioxygenase-like lactoylglutathione lyase family enzyme
MAACAGSSVKAQRPDIIATNAFYYYADVDVAWEFYRDTLGFETVVDYGFAKIMRVASSSYLTLVRASEGMHSVDEPKTVTLSLITDELTHWNEHLVAHNVAMRVPHEDKSSNSFVAIDPGGYDLKFVRFNPHPGHVSYVPAFTAANPVEARLENVAGRLSIRATAFSAYFDNLQQIRPFYEKLFDVRPIGLLQGVDAYQLSDSGFLFLVDGADELHSPTEKAGMTLSFLSTDVDAWWDRAVNMPGFELRTPEILDEGGGLVRVFVGYDPVGTFLEWDTFADVPENAALSGYLH